MDNLCIEDQTLEETTIKTDLEIDISEIEENLEIENEIDVDSMPEKTSNSESLVFKSKSMLIFSVYGSLLISSVSRFCWSQSFSNKFFFHEPICFPDQLLLSSQVEETKKQVPYALHHNPLLIINRS